MVFSVFTQPVFLFSDSRKSNYFGPKAHSPGSRAGRAEAWGPRLPASSWYVGLARPHLLVSLYGVGTARQGSTGGFLIQKTKKPTVKPHDARFIKICAIILI